MKKSFFAVSSAIVAAVLVACAAGGTNPPSGEDGEAGGGGGDGAGVGGAGVGGAGVGGAGVGGGTTEGQTRTLEVQLERAVALSMGVTAGPVSDVVLLSHDADGALIVEGVSNAEGFATIEVVDGGFVSVALMAEGTPGFFDAIGFLTTIRVVPELETLRIPVSWGPEIDSSAPRIVDVSWPEVPGAESYSVQLGCYGGSPTEELGPTALRILEYQGCPGQSTFGVAVSAYRLAGDGVNWEVFAWSYRSGIELPASGETVEVVLDEIVPSATVSLTVPGLVDANEVEQTAAGRLDLSGGILLDQTWGDIQLGDGGAEIEMSVPMVEELPFLTFLDVNPYPCGAVRASSVGDEPESWLLDTERLARNDGASSDGHWFLGPGELGDAVRLNAEWEDATWVVWTMYEPAAPTGMRIPALEIPPQYEQFLGPIEVLADVTPVPQPADILEAEDYETFFRLLASAEPHHVEWRYRDYSCDPFPWE